MTMFEPLLSDVQGYSSQSVGGKAYNLHLALRLGLNIPPTWVIDVKHYRHHIELPLIKSHIQRYILGDTSADLLAEIFRSICETPHISSLSSSLAEFFDLHFQVNPNFAIAVRSSANCEDGMHNSFAGIFDSFLLLTELKTIETAIKKCWASIWTARAFAYSKRINLELQNISMGVILQEMLIPKVSGVAFTCDPVNLQGDVYVIETIEKVGEKLVSGEVSPTYYRLEATSGKLIAIDSYSNQEVTLTDSDLNWLWHTLNRIKNSFVGFQEVEWCIDSNNGYVLQTRSVTTAGKNTNNR